MPRAVAPWTWRRVLRDDGPDDPGFLLAMLILGTFMDESGFAYPGQPLWARGARKSVRMIQRYVARARREGWLGVVNAGRGGKGWAFNGYRCCVPDHVTLGEKDEQIADGISGVFGDIEDDDTAMAAPTNGHDTRVSAAEGYPNPPRTHGDDMSVTKVTTPRAHGDDTTGQKVTTQLWRTKSGSESSPLKLAPEEGALPRTAMGEQSSKGRVEPEAEVQRRIRKLQSAGLDAHDIAKNLSQFGVTAEEVRRLGPAP